MKKRNESFSALRNKKLVLNMETLRRLTRGELLPVVAGISWVSVCQENTRPECLLTEPC